MAYQLKNKAKWEAEGTSEFYSKSPKIQFAKHANNKYLVIQGCAEFEVTVNPDESMTSELSEDGAAYYHTELKNHLIAKHGCVYVTPKTVEKNGMVISHEKINADVYFVQSGETTYRIKNCTCTCKAYKFGRGKPCKHLKAVDSLTQEEKETIRTIS